MPGEAKKITLQFVVDPVSAQQAQRIMGQLINTATQLTKALNGTGVGGGGGGFGGSFVTGNVGGSQTSGQIRSAQNTARGPSANGQKSLAQVFIDSGSSLKNLANVSQSSMRVMSDSLKRAVEEQKRSLEGLDRTIDKVVRDYDRLKEAGQLDSPEGRKVGRRHLKLLSKRDDYGEDLDELQGLQKRLDAGSGGGGGFGRGLWNALTGKGPGPTLPAGLSSIPGLQGAIRGGIPALAFGAMSNAVDYVQWRDPMVLQEARAKRAGLWGDTLLETQRGNMSTTDAMERIMGNSSTKADFEKISQRGYLSSAWHNVQLKDLVFNQGKFLEDVSPVGVEQRKQEEMRKYVEMEKQADVITQNNMGLLLGGYRGRLSGMRQLGIGNYTDKVSGQYRTSYDDFLNAGHGRFSHEEVMGSALGIQSSGGARSLAHSMAYSALYSGMPGAEGIIGQMGEGGGENAKAFMDRLLTRQGDVAALARVGQGAAGFASAAGGGSGGLGVLEALSQGLNGSAGDMLTARQNLQGLQAYQGQITRGGDPYQRGVNTVLAAKYFGDTGAQGVQFAATGMNQDEVEEAARGRFSDTMKAVGLDKYGAGTFRKFQSEKEMTELLQRTVSGENLPPGSYMETVNRLRDAFTQGQSGEEYFKTLSAADRKTGLRDLAAAERLTHEGMDEGTAAGLARRIAFGYEGSRGRGGRIGAAGGEIEEKEATAANIEAEKFADWMKSGASGIKDSLDKLKIYNDKFGEMVHDLTAQGSDMVVTFAAISAALKAVQGGTLKAADAQSFVRDYVNHAKTAESSRVVGDSNAHDAALAKKNMRKF